MALGSLGFWRTHCWGIAGRGCGGGGYHLFPLRDGTFGPSSLRPRWVAFFLLTGLILHDGHQATGPWAPGALASFLFHWLEMRSSCIHQGCKFRISGLPLFLSSLLANRLIPFRAHLFSVVSWEMAPTSWLGAAVTEWGRISLSWGLGGAHRLLPSDGHEGRCCSRPLSGWSMATLSLGLCISFPCTGCV